MTRNNVNVKRNATTNVAPSIVLKTLHNDIMRDNANATIDTKRMRVWLRANMNEIHAKNDAWIFTQSQYDIVRAHFDATYRAKIERATKRATKTNVTPRKRATKTNVVDNVIDDANVNDDVIA